MFGIVLALMGIGCAVYNQAAQTVREAIATNAAKARFEADQANKEREKQRQTEKFMDMNREKWALEDEKRETESAYKTEKLRINMAMIQALYSHNWTEYKQLEIELERLENEWRSYQLEWIKRRLQAA